jgi:chromatin assembly factor 1 subunit B
MKVETPQILWIPEADKGINAALMSVDMVASGFVDNNVSQSCHVLATAGNDNDINLWRVSFADEEELRNTETPETPIFEHRQLEPSTSIHYICSLSRHEGPVNVVKFSPDGLHLATAGDTGTIIVWSVPVAKRGNGNGRHFWSSIAREADLHMQIVTRTGEGIADVSWSADSKRFLAGSIDHSVFCVEDANYVLDEATFTEQDSDLNASPARTLSSTAQASWKIVYRNGIDHTHFVQGVAYDPLGVYLASMSSDRTVRVWTRKSPLKKNKQVLRPVNVHSSSVVPPVEQSRNVGRALLHAKLDVMTKSKQLKYRRVPQNCTTTAETNGAGPVTASPVTPTKTIVVKQHLFADEPTLQSFFRRLSWTTDGAFLVTPAALYHPPQAVENEQNNPNKSEPVYATYLYARHKMDEPYKVLAGLETPSVAVRPNPVLFQLPSGATHNEDCKENQAGMSTCNKPSTSGLPYRSIFAVLTWNTVLIYDTYHDTPLSVVKGLHYANLSDATWSDDGHVLIVSSTDGYVSVLQFALGELGVVYTPTPSLALPTTSTSSTDATMALKLQPEELVAAPMSMTNHRPSPCRTTQQLPPCEPGQTYVVAPPAKRAKTRITPTLIANPGETHRVNGEMNATCLPAKRAATETVEHAVDKLSLNAEEANVVHEPPIRKKKRIQPILLSSS